MKRGGLGRGLDVLLPQTDSLLETVVRDIDIDDIDPNVDQPRREFDQEALKQLMIETIRAALETLCEMRIREGREIMKDLTSHVDQIERITLDIEKRYPETVQEHTARLRAAIEELVGQNVDETRLLTEVAIMADRSAIDEETVRLKSHVSQLREVFKMEEPIGRRVDFIVQELNREVNTISSKSQDIPITNLAVEGKAVIEKLREQIQNIE